MTSSKPQPGPSERDAKLAAALRANLRRRKAGADVARKAEPPEPERKS